MDIDITSLLDILVILLVFLLKSYNASSLKLDIAQKLDIAASEQRKLGQDALIIQVDKDNGIWVKNKRIASISDMSKLESVLQQGRSLASAQEKKEGKRVNLVFDKDLEYSDIQKVMNLCAENAHTKFKLIVKGNF